jgi:hypothetical protein
MFVEETVNKWSVTIRRSCQNKYLLRNFSVTVPLTKLTEGLRIMNLYDKYFQCLVKGLKASKLMRLAATSIHFLKKELLKNIFTTVYCTQCLDF